MAHLDDHLDTPTTEGAGAVVWALAGLSLAACTLAGLAGLALLWVTR